MRTYTYEVSASTAGRLDAFLGAQIAEISREKIKKAIQQGQCRVDGLMVKSASAKVKAGQSVELMLVPPATHITPEEGEVDVLWADEHILVCHKPAGLTVHPCPSCMENTLIQRLAGHYPQLLQQEGQRPGIVHRLDKDTSGLMVVALTEEARLILAQHFAERRVHKQYLALVQGVPAAYGEIQEPIGRHPMVKVKMAVVPEQKGGRAAHSAWEVLYADPEQRFSLVRVTIFTGRTHQIRVHMAHLGFPLWGDTVYGAKPFMRGTQAEFPAKRQMLHAWQLEFSHPITGEACHFYSAPPEDMLQCALALTQSMKKIVLTGLPGCGKSSLLQALGAQGIPTWSADAVVASLYAVGGAGHEFFASRFGTRFMEHKEAELNRKALRQAMQDDPFLRQEVECAIHGMVRENCQQFWEYCLAQGQDFAAAEMPLYLENSWQHKEEAHIVGVACPSATRHARLQQHRQWTAEQCEMMDSWQWSEEKKLAACHTVVDNGGALDTLTQEAVKLMQSLRATQEQAVQDLAEHLQDLWSVDEEAAEGYDVDYEDGLYYDEADFDDDVE